MGRIVNQIRDISSKVLTLSYPRYRFFTFLGVLILLRFLPFSIIEKTHNLSICYAMLKDNCFSVGITRGVSSILRGNLQKGIEYNFLSLPVLAILLGFLIYDLYKGFIKYNR